MQVERHEYTSAEKKMMVRSYTFIALQKEGLFSGKRTRELVAKSLGCSTDTAARVIAVYNASQKTDFELVRALLLQELLKAKEQYKVGVVEDSIKV
ncbi:hypothetical protein L915_00856 [Phytophthora nicotianae]|uniref:Uncharacterized protein n=1 Tax=Phytophthora nicotianae TaxID=4792 RepID=W2JTM7_PHYNI|nr:hypothetical protein L915_00856 [Phytophthora nicotianae]ETL49745.1 hypothetical protein L916_00846 [Phytophthora nicotianae]